MADSNSDPKLIEKDLDFSGNIFIFQAFDVGDDIDFDGIKKAQKLLSPPPKSISKYFKNYHTPLMVELPHPHSSSKCISANLHHFGAIGLLYQIPFNQSLNGLRQEFGKIYDNYQEQSVIDAKALFGAIKPYIYKPNFFHHKASYTIVQVDPNRSIKDIGQFKKEYESVIASLLRFEDQQLSEYQKKEAFNEDIGYYRKDFVLIDTECAFVYDTEYKELLNFFEFGNIQQLELQYFDKLLDQQLNTFYESKTPKIPIAAYLPFIGARLGDPISELNRLKVDISVITERLENSIKLAGEAYYSELYKHLKEKLDLDNWKESIEEKLSIIKDIKSVYNDKINSVREDILETSIIALIFIELMVGIFK